MKNIYLCDDLIDCILNKLDIKCHTCKLKYNINFFNKNGPYYFCTKECYNFI